MELSWRRAWSAGVLVALAVAVGIGIGTRSPPEPPLPVAPRAPRHAWSTPAIASGPTEVLATVYHPAGTLGPSLQQARGVAPYRSGWECSGSAGARAAVRRTSLAKAALDRAGLRPSRRAGALSRVANVLPSVALRAAVVEMQIAYRDVCDGSPHTEIPGGVEEILHAVVSQNPTSPEAAMARELILSPSLWAAPLEDHEQLIWEALVQQFQAGDYQQLSHPSDFIRTVQGPEIHLHDHEVMSKAETPLDNELVDLMLRHALARGDDHWTRVWWNRLGGSIRHKSWHQLGHLDELRAKRAALAGVVGAQLGEAMTWEDGLRRAAVDCAQQAPGRRGAPAGVRRRHLAACGGRRGRCVCTVHPEDRRASSTPGAAGAAQGCYRGHRRGHPLRLRAGATRSARCDDIPLRALRMYRATEGVHA